MKSDTLAQLLGALGISQSVSDQHGSDDDAFSETQLETLKDQPDDPGRVSGLLHARGPHARWAPPVAEQRPRPRARIPREHRSHLTRETLARDPRRTCEVSVRPQGPLPRPRAGGSTVPGASAGARRRSPHSPSSRGRRAARRPWRARGRSPRWSRDGCAPARCRRRGRDDPPEAPPSRGRARQPRTLSARRMGLLSARGPRRRLRCVTRAPPHAGALDRPTGRGARRVDRAPPARARPQRCPARSSPRAATGWP